MFDNMKLIVSGDDYLIETDEGIKITMNDTSFQVHESSMPVDWVPELSTLIDMAYQMIVHRRTGSLDIKQTNVFEEGEIMTMQIAREDIITKLKQWLPSSNDNSKSGYSGDGLVGGYIAAIEDLVGKQEAEAIRQVVYNRSKVDYQI